MGVSSELCVDVVRGTCTGLSHPRSTSYRYCTTVTILISRKTDTQTHASTEVWDWDPRMDELLLMQFMEKHHERTLHACPA